MPYKLHCLVLVIERPVRTSDFIVLAIIFSIDAILKSREHTYNKRLRADATSVLCAAIARGFVGTFSHGYSISLESAICAEISASLNIVFRYVGAIVCHSAP